MEHDDMPDLVPRPPHTFSASAELVPYSSSPESQVLPPPTARTTHTRLRDSSYIPRPPNAFILFRSAFIQSQKLAEAASGRTGVASTTNNAVLSRIIGGHWRALPQHEKEEWEEKARIAQEEHRKRYPDWRFRPGGFRGGPEAEGRSIGKKKRPPARAKVRKKSGEREAPEDAQNIVGATSGSRRVGAAASSDTRPTRGRGRGRPSTRSRVVVSTDSTNSSPGLNVPVSPTPSSSPTSVSAPPESAEAYPDRASKSTRRTRSTGKSVAPTKTTVRRGQDLEENIRDDQTEHMRKGKSREVDPSWSGTGRTFPSTSRNNDYEEDLRRAIDLSKQDHPVIGQSSSSHDFASNIPALPAPPDIDILDYDLYEEHDSYHDQEYNDDMDDDYNEYDDSDSDYVESEESEDDDYPYPTRRAGGRAKKRKVIAFPAEDETENEGTVTGSRLQRDVPLTSMFRRRMAEERRSSSLPPVRYANNERNNIPITQAEGNFLLPERPYPPLVQGYHPYGYPAANGLTAQEHASWEGMEYQKMDAVDPQTSAVPTSPATEPPTSPVSSPDTSSRMSWTLASGATSPSFAWYPSAPMAQRHINAMSSPSVIRREPPQQHTRISSSSTHLQQDNAFISHSRGAGGSHARRDTVSFPLSPSYHERYNSNYSYTTSLLTHHSSNAEITEWTDIHDTARQHDTSQPSIPEDHGWDTQNSATGNFHGVDTGVMGYIATGNSEQDFVILHDSHLSVQPTHVSSTSTTGNDRTIFNGRTQSSDYWQNNEERVGIAASVVDPYIHSSLETHISTFSTLSNWAGDITSSSSSFLTDEPRPSNTNVQAEPESVEKRGWYDATAASVQPLGLAGGSQN